MMGTVNGIAFGVGSQASVTVQWPAWLEVTARTVGVWVASLGVCMATAISAWGLGYLHSRAFVDLFLAMASV